jgi:acyl-CoA thioesterase-1
MRKVISLVLLGGLLIASNGTARAQALTVVALGASNTEGMGRGRTNMGVPREQAYPAQLERLLRARGVNARVINAGAAGDTTGGMLARLDSSVPNGTSLLILQPGGNDARRGVGGNEQANVAEIKRRMQARNIPVLVLHPFGAGIGQYRLADGQHFSAEGHAAVAGRLLPQVLRVVGR